MNSINLPNILSLLLENFSLYPGGPVEINFDKPISCLMGANGIGKSTLLNCVNFGITGKINQSGKKLQSINDLDAGNNYAFKYFDGRINESDKDFATVQVKFLLGAHEILVKRRFFPDGQIVSYKCDGVDQNLDNYKNDVIEYAKLKNFSQFVFLQLKVLSFDEGRDCLFWSPSILTPTLFLCLGEDVENAIKADNLANEIQRMSSRIRNVQWEITKQGTRLSTLIEEREKVGLVGQTHDSEDEENSRNKYESICQQIDSKSAEYEGYKEEQQLVYAKAAELSVEKMRLESDYKGIYSNLFVGQTESEPSILVKELTTKGCPICHTIYKRIPDRIIQCIDKEICPVCGKPIPCMHQNTETVLKQLQEKDGEIAKIDDELNEKIKRQQYLDDVMENLSKSIADLNKEKSEIEAKKYSFLTRKNDGSWDERIQALNDSIAGIEKEKAGYIAERDKLKVEYEKVYHDLETGYQTVQQSFLPMFKKYAKSFTGLDLDIELSSISEDSRRLFRFILQIDDSNRDNEFELSESQRFFIDIALRMAIICFCSEGNNSSMLIDTPEGSLDIAYETNAGTMFYDYVQASQKLIITANLNASGLTRTLAGLAKADNFSLINMLRWAKLSSVQNKHIDLFESSIATIAKEMR